MGEESDVLDLTDQNFENFIRNNALVLADFWAPWCMPCKLQGRILGSGMKDMPQGLKVVKVNVDENVQTARKYNVRGIPQMYLFVNGRSVRGWTGVTPAEVIFDEVKKHLTS